MQTLIYLSRRLKCIAAIIAVRGKSKPDRFAILAATWCLARLKPAHGHPAAGLILTRKSHGVRLVNGADIGYGRFLSGVIGKPHETDWKLYRAPATMVHSLQNGTGPL